METKIVTAFEALCRDLYTHRAPDIFQDLLSVMLYRASMGRAMRDEYDTIQATYNRTDLAALERFTNDIAEAAEDFQDPLGLIYESLSAGGYKSVMGQFFTPHNITAMMAEIAITSSPVENLRMADNAGCGSGRMILAAARKHGATRWRHFYEGVDLDTVCVRIAAINCWLQSIPAWLILGDGLDYEVRDGFEVRLMWHEGHWLPFVVRFPSDQLENIEAFRRAAAKNRDVWQSANAGRVVELEQQKQAAVGKGAEQLIQALAKLIEQPAPEPQNLPVAEPEPEPEQTPTPPKIVQPEPTQRTTKRKAPPAQGTLF